MMVQMKKWLRILATSGLALTLALATACGEDAEPAVDPGEGLPGEGDPGEGDPGEGDPGEGDPGEGDPGEGDPGEGDPAEGDPGEGDPGEGDPGTEGFDVASSALTRNLEPAAGPNELDALVAGNAEFALDLFAWIRDQEPNDNLFFSPHSISVAMAMTYAGAKAQTADEIEAALRFGLTGEALHDAMNALALQIDAREEVEVPEGDPFALRVVNAMWGLDNYPYEADFLDTLALHYGAAMHLVDFIGATEQARQTINAWVSKATNELIPELIPQGAIDPDTRLVLTNAIYFFAGWLTPFNPDQTTKAPFFALDGTEQEVDMMSMSGELPYGELDGHQIIELPYVGEQVSMVVILPEETGGLPALEAGLDAARLNALLGALGSGSGAFRMPKFEMESKFSVKNALTDLGMPSAFIGGVADFTGITDAESLFIFDVLHQGVVKVDEEGTEAAAATAVIIGVESAPSAFFDVTLDRPFLFLIRDRVTGAVLFLGRFVSA